MKIGGGFYLWIVIAVIFFRWYAHEEDRAEPAATTSCSGTTSSRSWPAWARARPRSDRRRRSARRRRRMRIILIRLLPSRPCAGARLLGPRSSACRLVLGRLRRRRRPAAPDDGRLSVVASFYPLVDATRGVGGDRVEVTNLTPAGVEPHDIELNPRQLDRVADADLVLYLGGGFQPAVEDAARRARRAVDLRAGLAGSRRRTTPTCGSTRCCSRQVVDGHRGGPGRGRPAGRRRLPDPGGRLPPPPRRARRRVPGRPGRLRPAHDRHHPRGLRVPGPPLRPRAGGHLRPVPRRRARPPPAGRADRPGPRAGA